MHIILTIVIKPQNLIAPSLKLEWLLSICNNIYCKTLPPIPPIKKNILKTVAAILSHFILLTDIHKNIAYSKKVASIDKIIPKYLEPIVKLAIKFIITENARTNAINLIVTLEQDFNSVIEASSLVQQLPS